MTWLCCYYIVFLRIFPVVLNESQRLEMLAIGSLLKKEILLSCFISISWIKFLNIMWDKLYTLTCSIFLRKSYFVYLFCMYHLEYSSAINRMFLNIPLWMSLLLNCSK